MKKVIFSLALGTFGLGMAEFGIMGVLTELALDVGITIPAAGHMISFYAFGVVLGAPVMALFFFSGYKTASLTFAFICCAGLFALSAPLQILLLQNAKGGELLGAAGGQIAFNLGSAIGAWCGGLMLTLGFAYHYVALPAALLSFSAMSSLLVYGRLKHKQPSVTPVAG
ncbi:hypothetical protein CA470_07910 [Salmonella enterica]|nr:hypothetical protein [Salmonella enterica]EBR6858293.1 hypothetical protein [Salmonella enterica]EEO1400016.1 hypothetical protein [Salmonella enterica]